MTLAAFAFHGRVENARNTTRVGLHHGAAAQDNTLIDKWILHGHPYALGQPFGSLYFVGCQLD